MAVVLIRMLTADGFGVSLGLGLGQGNERTGEFFEVSRIFADTPNADMPFLMTSFLPW